MTEVFPFYMYGTARVGLELWPAIKGICEEHTLAKAPGSELMMDHQHDAYPYLCSRRPAVKPYTYGDLCLLRRSTTLDNFVAMEVAAGYSLEAIPVEHDLTGVGGYALAFVWKRSEVGMYPLGSSSWITRSMSLR